KPDKYNKPFIFFGLSLGTPGLLNITIGTYCEIFGFQASFSFLHIIDAILTGESDDKYENNIEEEDDYSFAFIQLNANVKLYKTRNFLLSFSIGGGTYHIDDEGELQNNMSIFYIGSCFHIFYYNLFLELGIAYGKDFETKLENESTGLLPMVQIGYIKRLL
ncbi:MAG: hypothetical protein SVR08_10785, partial [Spirochaetota bacterium]|nr:hypothetical protein [Spirochaetota bacterium]